MNTTEREEYLGLNPDAFTRFHVCTQLLKKNFQTQPINILDVGGGSKYFRSALMQDQLPYQLTVIDILPPPENPDYTYVQGDATQMDFADNSFDAVVSMDVLEHIPDERKPHFLAECYRVAKDLVIVAAPFESVETTQAETIANDFFKQLHGRNHPWLIEHFEQNKPTTALMEAAIKKFGCPFTTFESNYLPDWLKLILANFVPETVIDPTSVRQLNRYYNEKLLNLSDFTAPGYRHFYILYKNSNLKKVFNQYFELTPSVVDRLTFEQKMAELFASELVAAKTTSDAQSHQLNEMALAVTELTTRVEETATHAGNLQAMLDDIHNSKAYKLAHGLGSLKRILRK